jgi:hypothetical protein
MNLSPEAKELKKKQMAVYMRRHWLKKAAAYGIAITGREDEAIREAKREYDREYWERKAQELSR